MLTGIPILSIQKPSAHHGRCAKNLEIFGRGVSYPGPSSPFLSPKSGIPLGPCGDRLERRVCISYALEIGIRPPVVFMSPDYGNHVHDPVLIRHTRNRGKPDGKYRREQCGVHTDSHSKGEDGHEHKAAGFSETPDRVTKVLEDVGEDGTEEPASHASPVYSATVLNYRIRVPESPQYLFPSLLRGFPFSNQLLDSSFEVECNLVIQTLL